MKLRCLSCGHEFNGSIELDNLGWHSVCPECDSSFDVDVPNGKIIVCFAALDTVLGPGFVDDHTENCLESYYAFESAGDLAKAWWKWAEHPDSMWYWVIDATCNEYVTTGACAIDCDMELFKDWWPELEDIEI